MAVLGDSPDYYSAKAGVPFSGGRTGAMFDELAALAELPRDELLTLYTVRCRPPNNRLRDHPEALSNCAVWTKAELEAYAPKVLVLMGAQAIKTVFGAEATVAGSRGVFAATPAKGEWGWKVVIATYAPGAASVAGGAGSEIGQQVIEDLRTAKRASELLREVSV